MAYKAIDIANAFIQKAQEKDIELSNMKLQKLLYYLQGWYLAVKGEEVFPEEFKKWAWGPVVPPVYNKFRSYKADSIKQPHGTPTNIPEDISKAMDFVLKHYGRYTAVQLADLSHKEDPYLNTEDYETISKVEILKYFSALREQLYPTGNA